MWDRDWIIADLRAAMETGESNLSTLQRRMEHELGLLRSHFKISQVADKGNFFGYDALGRLEADTFATVVKDNCTWDPAAGWVCPDPATPDSSHTYQYDAVGNLLSLVSDVGPDKTGTYGTGNRVQSFDGCTYTYDGDSTRYGNVTFRDCASQDVRFWWTIDNRLRAVKVVSGDSLDFRYDASGRLVRWDKNGVIQQYFLWHGDNLYAELNASGGLRAEYSYYPGLDNPHAVVVNGTVYFAHRDGMGNLIGLVSATKTLAAT